MAAMFNSVMRLCAVLLLASSVVPNVSADSGGTRAIFIGPVFQISSISADDAGGIYNGSTVTISVTVHNAGAGAGQWQATLSIPDGYDFIESNPCGGDFYSQIGRPAQPKSLSGTYLVWPHGTDGNGSGDTLASGQSSTCNVRLSVTTVTANDVAFTSVYSGPYSFGNGNLADSKTYTFNTTSTPTTDMAIAINSSKSSVMLGSSVDYTLTASNVGRQTGTNVRTDFNFPPMLSVVPKNCPGASTLGGSLITWTVGNVNYGTSATCVLTATAQSGAGTNATVTANISASTADPNTSNNSASNTIAIAQPPPPQTDLAAAISANANVIAPGQSVTLTLKVSNLSGVAAASTQLTAKFPPQLQLNSASCASGTPTSPLVWNVGTLAAGASQSCTVQTTLNATSATSIAVSDSVGSATADSNIGNNSASVTIVVNQTPAANLEIHLAGAPSGQTYTPGQVLSFTVTAINTSNNDAAGVIATVHLPNDGSLSGFHAGCGTIDATATLIWSIGALPRNSSQTCTVSATVVTSTQAIALSARIDASVLGSNLDHLTDALVIPVSAKPRQISATASGAPTTKDSTHVTLNGDGSVAVFQSQETDLVAGNANTSGQDIYRVGSDGNAVLETLGSTGTQLIGTASLPAVSGDGGIVAFAFAAGAAKQAKDAVTTNMWAGSSGQPKHQVDTGMAGAAPNGPVSGAPSVASANGSKKLVFCSAASNLVTSDTNGARDVFLVDPTNPGQAPQLISTDNHGNQIPGDSCEPKISDDATKVVFTISAPNLYGTSARQVARKDLTTGKLEIISGVPTTGAFANGDCSEPTINADGSVIAFTSQASNLDSLGAPVGGQEAFVSLAPSGAIGATRTLKRVRSGDGTVPNGASQHPQLSNDGTIVVMQTSATNFFGEAKALGTSACGAVAITTNFFSPAALGSNLCAGSTSNQNPSISGDGTMTSFDSNAPQPDTSSSNSNTYTQGISGLSALGTSNFGGDFSGQWFDSHQNGQGLVIDVTNPDANNNRAMILTWFVFANGRSTWLQGVGTPHAGSGAQAGMVVVQMSQVGIFQGKSFPLGEAHATGVPWGSITLTFVDANTGSMNWTSSYPGFNSGTMAITHFLSVSLPSQDPPGAQIKACYSGNWFNPAQTGHGFEFEVLSSPSPLLVVDWFAYGPDGSPVWLQGVGPINGNGAQVSLQLINGSGAQFPPKYDPAHITQNLWGTASFTFTDSAHASVTWISTITGYGTGTQPLQPLAEGLLDRRGCQ
jgi:uncharacterized repeat protein (TIGR01451 family)